MNLKHAQLINQGKLPTNQLTELSDSNLNLLLQLIQVELLAKQQKKYSQPKPSAREPQDDQDAANLN